MCIEFIKENFARLLIIILAIVVVYLIWKYHADKMEFMSIKYNDGSKNPGDLTNDYGNTNTWNERSDKRIVHTDGMVQSTPVGINKEAPYGSRAYESVYTQWMPTPTYLPWQDASKLKKYESTNPNYGLTKEQIENYLLNIS